MAALHLEDPDSALRHLRTAVEALADKVRCHEEALRRIDRPRRAR